MVSRYEPRLKRILELTASQKVTERKKCITELMKFLDEPEAVKEVDENTIQRNSLLTWDRLLNAIHNFLLWEIDKTRRNSPQDQAQIEKVCSGFLSVVYHSHKRPRMLITPRDVVSYVIQVLGSRKYQICHDVYMCVLSNYVLLHQYYYARISQEQWRELWRICVVENLQGNENPESIINVVHKLVKFNCVHSQMHFEVKRILPALEDIFKRVKKDSYPSLFALMNTVVQHIGKECRMFMCDFTERLLVHLRDSAFCGAESYKFLLFTMIIHHPEGVCRGNQFAYASDWDRWNNVLRFLHIGILKNLNDPSDDFLNIACEVFNQILQMEDVKNVSTELPTSCDISSSRATKRRRLELEKYKLADLMSLDNNRYYWGVVRITIRLIDKYPSLLKVDDILPFMNEIVKLLMKSVGQYEVFTELNMVLRKIVPNLAEVDNKLIETFDTYWENLNDLGYRSLRSVDKQKAAILLLRSLIDLGKMRKSPNLIGDFRYHVIEPSFSGIFMLESLLDDIFLLTDEKTRESMIPSDSNTYYRVDLLQWILNVFYTRQNLEDLPLSEISRLVLGLILKPWHKNFEEKHRQRKIIERKRTIVHTEFLHFLREIEECQLVLTFNSNLLVNSEKAEESGSLTKTENVKISYDEQLGNALIENLRKQMEKLTKFNRVQGLICFATLVGRIATDLNESSLMIVKEQKLFHLIRKSLINASELLKKKHFFQNKIPFVLNSRLKSLILLYETPYSVQVSEIIVSATSLEMISLLFGLMESEQTREAVNDLPPLSPLTSSSYRRNFHRNHFEETKKPEDVTIIYVAEALSAFYSKPIGMEMLEIQRSTLLELLTIENFVFSSEIHLEMAIQIINRTFAHSIELHYPKDALEQLENFLVKFYDHSYRSEEIARLLLRILPKALTFSWYSKKDVRKLLKIVMRIRQRLREKHYGPQVYHEYFDFLSRIKTELNIDLQIRLEVEMENGKLLFDDVLDYVDSPFYNVRLSTLRCVQAVFTGTRDSEWQKVYFKHLKKAIRASFRIVDDFQEGELQDQKTIRVSIAVHLYAFVARFNVMLQKHALTALLKLAEKLSLDNKLIWKLLNFISEGREKENAVGVVRRNLSFLIRCWFTPESTLENFPWILTGSESEEDFFQNYWETIVPVFMENQKFDMIVRICESLKIPFSKVSETCFVELFSWLLCNVQPETDGNQYPREALRKLEENEDEFATMRPFATLLREKFEDVMLFLVRRLNDKEHFGGIFDPKVAFPDSNFPDFRAGTIRESLNYLMKYMPSQESSLIGGLSKYCPSILQKVLMDLTSEIYRFEYVEERLKSFHQYAFFCEFIADELKTNGISFAMSAYVVRDISHTFLYLIKENTKALSEIACKCFHNFLKKILPERITDVEEVLGFAVPTLCRQDPAQIPSVVVVLRLLILEQSDVMREALKGFDSFPNHPSFDEIREFSSERSSDQGDGSLRSVVMSFMDSLRGKKAKYILQNLMVLRKQLSERQDEIKEAYEKLHSLRGFAEDCTSSVLHRLIYTLLKIAENKDIDVSVEVLRCLGELGPTDLTTMILHPEKNEMRENIPVEDALTCKVILYLVDCLKDPDVYQRKAASESLYAVLRCPWGHKFLDVKYMKTIEHALAQELEADADQETNADLELKPESYRMKYLYPFIAKTSPQSLKPIKIDWTSFEDCFDAKSHDFWVGKPTNSFSNWIGNLTGAVASCFENFYTKSLVSLCHLDERFCQMILPRMFYLLFQIDKRTFDYISRCVNVFFEQDLENSKQDTIASRKLVLTEKTRCSQEAVRCMMNVVSYFRIQSGSDRWTFNYMCIAKAAQYCSAYFTSVFYSELHANLTLERRNQRVPSDYLSKIEYLYDTEPILGKELQDMLREDHVKIGDPDGIYGCGTSYLGDPAARVQFNIHTNQWNDVLLAQDVRMCYGNCTTSELIVAMINCSLLHILGRYITCESNVDPSMFYHAAWRLSDWTLLDKTSNLPQDAKAPYHHYQALKSFHNQNDVGVLTHILNARKSVVVELRNVSLESTTTLYEKLGRLQMLRELEEIMLAKPDNYANVLSKWEKRDVAKCNIFRYVEPILTQRLLIYEMVDSSYSNDLIRKATTNNHLTTMRVASQQGYPQTVTKALVTLSTNNILLQQSKDEVCLEEAQFVWNKKYEDLAKHMLNGLMSKSTLDPSLRSKALRTYGNWMAEIKSGNPRDIFDQYYMPSIKTSKSIGRMSDDDRKHLNETYVTVARYADALYQELSEYMQSTNYKTLMSCLESAREGLKDAPTSTNKDVRRAIYISQKQVALDTEELTNIALERDRYMLLAFQYYLKVLCVTEEYNSSIFRVANMLMDYKYNDKLNQTLNKALNYLPSHKFVVLVPQLAPHLSDPNDLFANTVQRILKTCVMEHPHHTLPVLLILSNLHGDCEFDKTSLPRDNKEPRIIGAKKLLSELSDSKVSKTIEEMQTLSHALVMFANTEIESRRESTSEIPSNQEILKVRGLENSLLPTITLDVDRQGNYNRLIGIHKYKNTYQTVGGNNTSKMIFCIGTDGICRKQLLKGKDDLRQDAMMQQVFNVINTLLDDCKATKLRKLCLRTYKVVPLTERSGILEWCENTIPLVKILADEKQGMHVKYFPNDLKATDCRNKIKNASKGSLDVKLKAYLECCEGMNPAFHYFFTEKYPSPGIWFEKRLAYTRSVATTSMVGFILGLGDRHLSNILMDQLTAEVIHINFGIAFDQGKVLQTPENVPFRLTRDIEVAMGVYGVEGTMRRCCEETMELLRRDRLTILTLLQVLLYDPLYSWTLIPSTACNVQGKEKISTKREKNQGPVETNKDAVCALLRLDQKLQGLEEGLVISVSGQVERLIQEARDPNNLCRIYDGWQPFL